MLAYKVFQSHLLLLYNIRMFLKMFSEKHADSSIIPAASQERNKHFLQMLCMLTLSQGKDAVSKLLHLR